MNEADNAFPEARRSASADAALRAEIRRVEKMTIEERMQAALSLRNGFLRKKEAPRAETRGSG